MKKEIRQMVWKKYNKHCAYCGCKLEYKQMQIDHIKPIYHDWSDEEIFKYKLERGEDILENMNPTCRQCNFYKSTLSIEDFRQRVFGVFERVHNLFLVKIALKYGLLKIGKPFDRKFYYEKTDYNATV